MKGMIPRKLIQKGIRLGKFSILILLFFVFEFIILPEISLETTVVPDKLLEMAFQKGKSVERVKYEEIKKNSYSKTKQTIIEKPVQNNTIIFTRCR